MARMLLHPPQERRIEAECMTPQQIELVQKSWAKIVPIEAHAATIFYYKLFELEPALKTLFQGDMAEQKRKLTTMIGVAVNGLSRLDTLAPAVRDLGHRHASYGVQPAHYATVGSALLWTLGQGLGPAFSVEIRDAWTAAYSILAATMQQGAAAVAA